MKHIYLFNNTSIASKFGVGTYISQLTGFLENVKDIILTVVTLNAEKGEMCVTYKNNVCSIIIPKPIVRDYLLVKKRNYKYYRNVLYLLSSYIENGNDNIFHLNFMNDGEFAALLKKKFCGKVVLTVHYKNWAFSLAGDTQMLKTVLNKKTRGRSRIEKSIVEEFNDEKAFMQKYCDKVIAIANHSYITLSSIYGIDTSKLVLINNAIEDRFLTLNKEDKIILREKYYIKPEEKVLFFAGRLDEGKGLFILIEAFRKLLNKDRNLHLFVSGEGQMNRMLEQSIYLWSKISFTGFLDKPRLYELCSMADVGVMPSLHEEFGYVAVEMMMNGLPVVVNDSTGLSEIVEDGVDGVKVLLKGGNENIEDSAVLLADKLQFLLDNKDERIRIGKNARESYLNKYEQSLFIKKMCALYESL